MDTRKIQSKSQAKILGRTEAIWEIVDWTGPLSDFMRSKAECFVNVPTAASANLQLRFHLGSYKCLEEPQQNFCQTLDHYKIHCGSCGCSTCKRSTPQNIANIPAEFLPQIPTRSGGHSLLVDVLNTPSDQLALIISVDKLNGVNINVPKNNLVILESNLPHQNITVVDKFWRTVKWTVGESGNSENCRQMTDNVKDTRFRLTVTAYQMESTGTDSPIAAQLPNISEKQHIPNAPSATTGFAYNIPSSGTVNSELYNTDGSSLVTVEVPRINLNTGINSSVNFAAQPFFSQNGNGPIPCYPMGFGGKIIKLPFDAPQPNNISIIYGPRMQEMRTVPMNTMDGKTWTQSSHTNAFGTTDSATVSQNNAAVKQQQSMGIQNTDWNSAAESATSPKDDIPPSSSSESSVGDSDFEILQPSNNQKNAQLVPGKQEEVRKMQQDLEEMMKRLRKIKPTE